MTRAGARSSTEGQARHGPGLERGLCSPLKPQTEHSDTGGTKGSLSVTSETRAGHPGVDPAPPARAGSWTQGFPETGHCFSVTTQGAWLNGPPMDTQPRALRAAARCLAVPTCLGHRQGTALCRQTSTPVKCHNKSTCKGNRLPSASGTIRVKQPSVLRMECLGLLGANKI